MRYIVWALIALVGYSLIPPLMSIATRDMSSEAATFGATAILALGALVLAVIAREPLVEPLTSSHAIWVLLAGIVLVISIPSFFRALSLGPVNVVTPIFGLFLVVSSIIGVVLLDEPLTNQRILGIGFAMLAIVLLSFE